MGVMKPYSYVIREETGMKQFILNCKLKPHVDFPFTWRLNLTPALYGDWVLLENDGSNRMDNYKSVLVKYYEAV